jgi:D-beta-D-heptose 7-phosphate kinase/D-beta-D-heptose 1-phosphate adenosyltransferase
MYETLLKTIGNLGSPRIVIVGEFALDVYVYGDAVRISPEAPVPVLKATQTEYRCGGAASVAADIAALGATPVCLGIVGADGHGEILRERLAACAADASGLYEVSGRATTTTQRLIGLAQHRHRQQLLRIDQEPAEPLPATVVHELLQQYERCVAQADVVCLQDGGQGLLEPMVCRRMIATARDAGRKVIVDPALSRECSQYYGATLLMPNRQEAAAAVGFVIETTLDAARAAQQLLADLALDAVVITLDQEGAYVATKDTAELVPARARNVYDVTGAGDVIAATLSVSLAGNNDYVTAAHLANIAGGIEVGKFGAATVTISEIEHEIAEQYGVKNTKLRSLDALLDELNWRRSRGQTIVFTNGCFDVIHRGHIDYLRFCRAQGDVVVIGLNSDSSVRALKGPQRPINNQYDRAAVLSGLETVDLIAIFDDPSVLGLVKQVRPDVLVKGGDWRDKQGVVGWEFVESYGGKVMLAPLIEGKSSTSTIEKMKALKANT